MKKRIHCGTINFESKRVAIFLNLDSYKKEFYELKTNELAFLDAVTYSKLDKMYNTPQEVLYMKESMKRKIAALLVAASIATPVANAASNNIDSNSKASYSQEYELMDESLYGYFESIDGLYAIDTKNSILTRGEACQLLYNAFCISTLENDSKFNDIEGHRNEIAIKSLSDNKLVRGFENNYYPDSPITGSEFLTILYRYISSTGNILFVDDVASLDLDIPNYALQAGSWAIKNGLVDKSFDFDTPLTKLDSLNIFYAFINKYDLLNEHIGMKQDAIEFLDALDENHYISKEGKEAFKTIARIINDHNIRPETVARIKNTFKNMFYATDMAKMANPVKAYYDFTKNTTIVNFPNSHTILHEGIHAATSDFENTGILGFYDTETNFGSGITESLTETLTCEYSSFNPEMPTYIYGSTLVRGLSEVLDEDLTIDQFFSGDLAGFIEQLMNIYMVEMPRCDAYDKAISLIGRFDTIKLFDTGELDLDEDYIVETMNEIKSLYRLKFGIDNQLLDEYLNRLLNCDDYLYYNIGKYYYNTEADSTVKITTLPLNYEYEDPNVMGVFNVGTREQALNYVRVNHPEAFTEVTYISDLKDTMVK